MFYKHSNKTAMEENKNNLYVSYPKDDEDEGFVSIKPAQVHTVGAYGKEWKPYVDDKGLWIPQITGFNCYYMLIGKDLIYQLIKDYEADMSCGK